MEDFNPQSSTTDKQSRTQFTSNRRKLILPVLVIILLVLIGFYFFNKKPANKETTNDTSNKTATNSAKARSNECQENQQFESVKQGYVVCYPAGWKTKEFLPSQIQVGFSQSEMDENFPGTITVSITDKTETIRTQEVGENSSKYEYKTITLDKTKGTQIIFTRSRTDSLIAYPRSVETVISRNKRTYLIALNSTEADLESNQKIYDQFLADFKFLDDVLDPPWAQSGNILTFSPWPGDTIKNPVDVEGVGIAFEGVIHVRIKDSDKHTLVETTLQAESGVERARFKGKVNFDSPNTKKGTVEIFTQSAKDGEEQDKVTIPINF